MRLFGRRGRSRSIDRFTKNRRSRHDHPSAGHTGRRDGRAHGNFEDYSVGSELPTLDQFEIVVPSKSFNNSSVGDHQHSPETRDEDVIDNRSATDISSITSVSYRAGYYYLRNIKKIPTERNFKQNGCLPLCNCAACQSCSCSWLMCCCCAEAKHELATAAAANKHTISGEQPLSLRDKHSRNLDRPGQRSLRTQGHLQSAAFRQEHQHQDQPLSKKHHKGHPKLGLASPARYSMAVGDQHAMSDVAEDAKGMYPAIKSNHSLFDELSEEEEMYASLTRGRKNQQLRQHKQKRKSRNKKNWLSRGRADPAYSTGYGAVSNNNASREKSGQSRSRGLKARA